MPARLETSSKWALDADLHWASTALVQQHGDESLIVDAETREFRLTLQRKLNDHIALQLQLPYRDTSGGHLDGFIDHWHDWFGLPEGARSELPSDRLNITYVRAGRTLSSARRTVNGLADIQAALGCEISSSPTTAAMAWLNIKVPTGDSDKLTGSGATDVTAVIAAEHRFDSRWSTFGQASATWLGDGDFAPTQQRSLVWGGMAGVSWQAWRSLSLKAQLDAHTAAFDTNLDFLAEAVVLTFGGHYRFDSGWRLDVGVSEDVAVEHSPDVAFTVGVKHDW